MKILCSLSSLEFTCEHFPGTFYSKETFHPIFHLEQKRLLPYLRKWSTNELTPVDSYLLFLALLKSSELVHFRVPVFRNDKTDSIVYNNMEYLAKTVIKLNTVVNPGVIFPSMEITPETRFLQNVHYWIENWDEAHQEFLSGKRRDYDDRKLVKREAALTRLIRNPHKNPSQYARDIAEWAAVAGDFPQYKTKTKSPFSGLPISLSDLWKEIIIRCCKNELLYSIPKADLEDLLTHCEEHISVGSIHSHTVFSVLRKALEKHKNFLDLGDMDLKTNYTMLEDSTSVGDANMIALINSAPEEEPRREQYPTNFKYLQAKLRWDMAQKYGRKDQEK